MDSLAQLTRDALLLPVDERILLAQTLWESLPDSETADRDESESAALEIAEIRDAQLDSEAVQGISHAEAIAKAQKSLECG